MSVSSVWDLIKLDKFEEACVRADAEFQESRNKLPLRNKIFALLQLNRLDESIHLSERIIGMSSGRSSSSDFIFLGVAHWLGGDEDAAIKAWRAGLNTVYSDAAEVEVPLILFFAGIRTQDEALKTEAGNWLKTASKAKRTISWPGPIARFLAGRILETALLAAINVQPILREKKLCKAYFYIGLQAFANGDESNFQTKLHACLNLGPATYLLPEPYLAKAELQKVRA